MPFYLASSGQHHTLLEEAIMVKKEIERCHLLGSEDIENVEDKKVEELLLAQLLQIQLTEGEIYLQAFSAMVSKFYLILFNQ